MWIGLPVSKSQWLLLPPCQLDLSQTSRDESIQPPSWLPSASTTLCPLVARAPAAGAEVTESQLLPLGIHHWVLAKVTLPLTYTQLGLTTVQAHDCGTGDSSHGWLWLENSESLSTQFFLLPLSQLSEQQRSFLSPLLLPSLYLSQAFLIQFYLGVRFKLTQSLKSLFFRKSMRNWISFKNVLHPISWKECWKKWKQNKGK